MSHFHIHQTGVGINRTREQFSSRTEGRSWLKRAKAVMARKGEYVRFSAKDDALYANGFDTYTLVACTDSH